MTRKRGRPRAYDPEQALDAAMLLFRTRGYAATTLDALSEATGMQRPSLYAAFGDKRALFDKALERFSDRMKTVATESMDGASVEDALSAILLGVIDVYAPADGDGHGCLVFGVASVAAVEDEQLRALVAQTIQRLDEVFERRIQRGVSAGELAPGTDTRTLARLLTSVVHSLSVRARSGASRRVLRQFARSAVTMLLSAPSTGS